MFRHLGNGLARGQKQRIGTDLQMSDKQFSYPKFYIKE